MQSISFEQFTGDYWGLIDISVTMSNGKSIQGGDLECSEAISNLNNLLKIEVTFSKDEKRMYIINFVYRDGNSHLIG